MNQEIEIFDTNEEKIQLKNTLRLELRTIMTGHVIAIAFLTLGTFALMDASGSETIILPIMGGWAIIWMFILYHFHALKKWAWYAALSLNILWLLCISAGMRKVNFASLADFIAAVLYTLLIVLTIISFWFLVKKKMRQLYRIVP